MTEWIGATEAAQRLGIKPASLYAYVSRGVLSRRRETGGRGSMYDAGEIDELARRGRPRRTGSPAELVFESALTEITETSQRYRGVDATDLALRRSFEDVAMLLWTGSLPPETGAGSLAAGAQQASAPGARPPDLGWQATPEALAAGRAAQAALPAGTLPLERLQVIVPALAATDQFRLHLDLPAVAAAGRALVAGMTGALPAAAGQGTDGRGTDGSGAQQSRAGQPRAGQPRVEQSAGGQSAGGAAPGTGRGRAAGAEAVHRPGS